MINHDSVNIAALEKWIDAQGFKSVRKHDLVQRLRKVRFLGTMHYTLDLKYFQNRYEHSLNVARLADIIAERLQLSNKLRHMAILMGLLHDIGHLPFSHASEVFFRQKWGRYHTGHGSRLARHLVKSLQLEGNQTLANLVEKANSYLGENLKIDSSFESNAIHEIFHGELSADTLEGITRAASAIGLPYPKPETLARGFVRIDESILISDKTLQRVYEFFNLKKKIYSEYVYSASGAAAEAMLTRILELTFSSYTDKEEFIALNDDNAIDRININSITRELYDQLNKGDIYYSLQGVAPEKYKLMNALYKRLRLKGHKAEDVKKSIELNLLEQLDIIDPSKFIVHSSIRLNFIENYFQQSLFSLPKPIDKIKQDFNTYQSYAESLDAFFPKDLIPQVKALKIPSSLDVFLKPVNNSDLITEKNTSIEKHRGAYMTPKLMADFLAEWAIRESSSLILDPSSGEGIFLKCAFNKLISLGSTPENAVKNIYGIESDPTLWQESVQDLERMSVSTKPNILKEDFFKYAANIIANGGEGIFDVVIGNPPYISFHRFQGEDRDAALNLSKGVGVILSQRTSSWAPYLICSSVLLKRDGRLAMVLPAELLTTDYGRPVREFLLKRFKSSTIVLFNKYIFNKTQQDVILLLASNDDGLPIGIRKIEVNELASLSTNILKARAELTYSSRWLSNKWTNLITNENILRKVDELLPEGDVHLFKDVASVSIGQVTGDNNFFLLSESFTKKSKIKDKWLVPVVANAAAIPGAIFTTRDFNKLQSEDSRCYMLRIPSTTNVLSDKALSIYLADGKRQGVNQGYKCLNRWPWHSVPMQPVPDAFFTYMSGKYPRLVLNKKNAYSTNTIHNVRFNKNYNSEKIAAYIVSFYSSLTGFSLEIMGRAYGGGVLKLEIGETNKIILPNLDRFAPRLIKRLASLLNEVDLAVRDGNIDHIIEKIDNIVLQQGLKLGAPLCRRIANERNRLVRRRIMRNR